jgi:type I restriction enzyme M protein
MANDSNHLVQKLWNYSNILRDDGLSYGDYPSASLRTGSERVTFLLVLNMADERT